MHLCAHHYNSPLAFRTADQSGRPGFQTRQADRCGQQPSRAQRLGLAVHGTNPVTADVVDQLLLVRTLVGTC